MLNQVNLIEKEYLWDGRAYLVQSRPSVFYNLEVHVYVWV